MLSLSIILTASAYDSFKDLVLFYMYGCFAFMYTCAPCACSTRGGQKGASDILDLEIEMVVRLHMGAGSQTLSYLKKQLCS